MAEPEYPASSVTVTVTEEVPAVVGVPVMSPDAASIDSPSGSPVAVYVSVAVVDESDAATSTGVMDEPERSDWSPGLATDRELVTVQVNEAELEYPASSVAVTVTEEVPAVVGVPVMSPDAASIDSPSGSPVADHVTVAVDEESVAESVIGAMVDPDRSDWSPGLAAATVLVIVHVNVAESVAPDPSVAVKVTEQVQAVVGVPVMSPVAGSTDSPAGSPVAPKERTAPGDESVAAASSGVTAAPDTSDWLPGLVTAIWLVTVHENEVVPENPAPSVAVTVTDETPAVVGVPVMVPDEPSIDRPAGRPVALHVNVSPACESVAVSGRPVMGVPEAEVWAPCPVTVTVLAMDHENVADPENPAPSVAVTVTEDVPPAVGVPVTSPVDGSIDRPAGRPVADQVTVAPDWVSAAEEVSVAMAVPDVPSWSPGFATVTVLVIVHVKVAVPDWLDGSVAVNVTEQVHGVVGVPVTVPVDELIERPAGRPVADHV